MLPKLCCRACGGEGQQLGRDRGDLGHQFHGAREALLRASQLWVHHAAEPVHRLARPGPRDHRGAARLPPLLLLPLRCSPISLSATVAAYAAATAVTCRAVICPNPSSGPSPYAFASAVRAVGAAAEHCSHHLELIPRQWLRSPSLSSLGVFLSTALPQVVFCNTRACRRRELGLCFHVHVVLRGSDAAVRARVARGGDVDLALPHLPA
mmetsp:Transcript_32901/g.82969  ORF Transcript_32901/g.82969 Transcript_32901/m.82969 type:complete len:209 (-) Transcript_32901:344-970(-)